MYNRNIIVAGLILFIALITFPVWNYYVFSGETSTAPEIKLSEKAKAAKECVRSKEYMKTEHMQLLDVWRDTVVREAKRVYVSPNGKSYNMSLSSGDNSCLGCHVDKAEFCDKCHNYASVSPYCWDCHIDPKEKK
ncbi:MAG: sulfate reduction electron transfer complex DsrMKJOP subunit DsrJ [Deltaproteobacteria bacterium]|nr:sulfate reduction electron transfer complex DsrMKJOP subunit DsrJ [Deltaproteobacteria bacterium]MBW1812709.1 sulfate reduction electron transfer complex DsrMKJOP subunit DsrJ [Deltaproteobacteria bacterium]MBW1845737.1 sulfate reduction electron transfer complex DsrMKJOP subunit DsrJ [Deltaproteobacteria bacterium]MBW1983864.1 sulfate reduction electron transfer complex DsrMKJOP subunit DsrJ [Deltaproteobacteria bacterium]MBW2179715.1 sulfate reduction electron transfer complex DsrMKJOP sub